MLQARSFQNPICDHGHEILDKSAFRGCGHAAAAFVSATKQNLRARSPGEIIVSYFEAAGLTMGQANAIIKRLGGREQALRFLRGELKIKLKPLTFHDFPVWKRVTIGILKSANAYRRALINADWHIALSAWGAFERIAYAQEPIQLDVALLSAQTCGLRLSRHDKELDEDDFDEGDPFVSEALSDHEQIMDQAVALGFEIAPDEVALALCLDYKIRGRADNLMVPTGLLSSSGDAKMYFMLTNDEGHNYRAEEVGANGQAVKVQKEGVPWHWIYLDHIAGEVASWERHAFLRPRSAS